MLEVRSYCDESYDEKSERVWVMAGYLGIAEEWEKFAQSWGEALSRRELSEFHMADCEHGFGEFKTRSGSEREELQREFIGIINSSRIVGAAGGIMLNAYNDLLPYIKQVRKCPAGLSVSGSLADPYFLAFQLVIELTVKNAVAHQIPENEKIAFIFDRHHLQGRATAIFISLVKSKNLDYVSHLDQRIVFGNRHKFMQIQAADILAYEYYRYLDGYHINGHKERWQWIEIKKKLPEWHVFDREQLKKLFEIS